MRIGELGRETGFKDKTIRYYERQGLIPDPGRTDSGYREYSSEDINRLTFIRKAKRLGMSLNDIKGVLQVHDRSEATCEHVLSLLDEKLVHVNAVLQDIQAFRDELASLKELEAEGIVGELTEDNYSFVGASSQKRLLQEVAPTWAELLKAKEIDAAVLVGA
ncbi:MAG: MerR family transcriptional regulator [Chloroflexi bacterium]|nr:MerR family transcriptional regulator [Chloroflexota bacterium]